MNSKEQEFVERFRQTMPDIKDERVRELAENLIPIVLTVFRIGYMEGFPSAIDNITGRDKNGARVN
jgi:hypothetical protein